MTAKIIYEGSLHTVATHIASGSQLETDAPVDNKGKGERFSPTDLVAVALGSCILTTMAIAADAREININGSTCEVQKVMVASPRKIGEIVVTITMRGQAFNDKERAILEHTAHTCPVHLSLHPDVKKTLTFNWQD